MDISKLKIPKKIKCSKFKNISTCNNNENCIWNNSISNNKMECVNNITTLFDEYVKIVRNKSGRVILENIAKELNVNYIGRTIKNICNDIQQILHVAMHGNTITTIASKLKLDTSQMTDNDIYYKIYRHIFDKLIESNHPDKLTEITHLRQILSLSEETHSITHSSHLIPGYIDFNKNKVLYNNDYSFLKRVEYARKVSNILKSVTKPDFCNFKKGFEKIKRIGTKSIAGEVYLGYNSDYTLPRYVAIKIMPVKETNRNELANYKFFTNYVLNNISPHFPIIYGSQHCKSCDYDNKVRFKGDCLVVLNELAEGDLKSYLKSVHTSYDLLCVFGQLIMTCLAIEHAGLVHNDMHWGNYLYHKVPTYKGKYIHYHYTDHYRKEHNIYLKNNGTLFIGWDFADMYPPHYGINDTLNIDLYRILHINKWSFEEGFPMFPSLANNICSLLKQSARNGINGVFGLLIYFNSLLNEPKIGKRNKEILLIDPQVAPSVSKIINTRPYELPL